ncbi:MAG: Lrp/AsnC family transcriptional regulator [Gammaproteobacteria bacterium]|uniref:Lrp/AsnC family transcriptional regulator n=1 Tax=Rheinheimera soli TaxID=443616 RepID=UPI000590C85F|nr:Lrp/AsnC family transcriptional regulator [Rheinheimera soli]MBU1620349.1 Lrp/AsnC family transcriptional regulator [Gammaproteobacteria bacterium]MBU2059332.1 Lrp/AsnC family transcriptional regulator [Gammaproteobacteria bacterium]MBU2175288.1 Lrp/AsnC family transcriptional regulator [Gammaproteobacteria bacterium]MBU2247496.1 Lrp/AsnC family transcriptional regulator [Gammaproteobacteria bacterium]MBU2342587.1 Lrp/AsnC family transcriptional regulator [Gammaproteobacteria bacterium]
MDKFDQHILAELKKDARQSVSTLAEKVSLSRTAVSDRIKRLEQSGVIRGYQVLLSESQKSAVSAYFEIQHRCGRCADVMHVFRAIPEVITCHGISGEMDLLVYVKTESMQRLHEIRELLDAELDVIKIRTHVVMSEWINNLG